MNVSLAALTAATLVAVAAHPALASPRPAGCVNPQDFMADPSDAAADAAPAIRAAITAARAPGGAHVVCLPGRTYRLLSTATATSVFDLTGATDLAIVGEGPATILQVGNLSATSIQVFDLGSGAARVRFQDLVVDGSGQSTGTPASSVFKIGGGPAAVADVALEAVQVVGAAGTGIAIDGAVPTAGVSIRGCRFATNRGSAIAVQGATRVLITANTFNNNVWLDIESGPTRAITGLTISHNVSSRLIYRTSPPPPPLIGQPLAIQLTAPAATPSRDLVIADNAIVGARVSVDRFTDVTITGNSIVGDAKPTSDPELLVTGGAGTITVNHNAFERTACVAGNVVRLGAVGTLSFVGNGVTQTAPTCPHLAALDLAGATSLVVIGNTITVAASAPTALSIGPAAGPTSYATVSNNTIAGASLASAIELRAGTAPVVLIADNVSLGAPTGVTLPTALIPTLANNVFAGATAITSRPATVALRGNLRGPRHFTGAGTPEAHLAAPIGSLYLQTDATSQGLWVKQSGTGTTGWVAKH